MKLASKAGPAQAKAESGGRVPEVKQPDVAYPGDSEFP